MLSGAGVVDGVEGKPSSRAKERNERWESLRLNQMDGISACLVLRRHMGKESSPGDSSRGYCVSSTQME